MTGGYLDQMVSEVFSILGDSVITGDDLGVQFCAAQNTAEFVAQHNPSSQSSTFSTEPRACSTILMQFS